jgi:hypothetical protein
MNLLRYGDLKTKLAVIKSAGRAKALSQITHSYGIGEIGSLYSRALSAFGLPDGLANPIWDTNSDPDKIRKYPVNYPATSEYARTTGFEASAEAFKFHVLEQAGIPGVSKFGDAEGTVLRRGFPATTAISKAHAATVLQQAAMVGARDIDPGSIDAIRAGLRPDLYTSPKSANIFGRASAGIKNSFVGQTDAKVGKFASTGKGNFLTGFLADIAMMASTGNFDFGQLISSAGFNLISALPKIGGPAAMAAGLLTTAATGGDMGRAMAGTIGSLIGGVLGNLIPIPFIGGMIGSILGGMLGDFVYTNFLNPDSAKQGTGMIQAGGRAVYNTGPNAPFPFGGPSNMPFSGEPNRKIGGRAFGGAVRPNVGYMVGERGPELLVPGGFGGSIIPNHKMRGPEGVTAVGGGQTVNASVVINNPSVSNAGDIDRLAKKVAEAQTRALRSAGYARPS